MLKKYLSIFIIVLLAVFITLSLLNLKSEYRAEKLLFKANTYLNKIMRNKEASPPGMYKKIIDDYKNIVNKFSKSEVAKRARLLLAQAYILKGDYLKAREELKNIIKDYPQDKELCVQAQFIIGNSYERQNDWSQALLQYERLIQDYGMTSQGLSTPLYIALYYQNKKMTAEAQAAFEKAIEYYKKVASENPKTLLGYTALSNTFLAYMNGKKLNEAAGVLEDLIIGYPGHPQTLGNFQAFSIICLAQLKDPSRMINFYQRFIQKYPKHALVNMLEKQIKAIKEKTATK